jgi:hypothetical protein
MGEVDTLPIDSAIKMFSLLPPLLTLDEDGAIWYDRRASRETFHWLYAE